jgi:hypothetical protein
MTDKQRKPVLCRFGIRHEWRTYSTEDGNRWQACARCGKDKDTGSGVDVPIMI